MATWWAFLAALVFFLVHIHPALSWADEGYNPNSNRRPQNITGINGLEVFYSRIGSYYNGILTLRVSPTSGRYHPRYGSSHDRYSCEEFENSTLNYR
ncbi:hypothetical protein BDW59DRAFT_146291 [Aspergillus cavernicola]|uniref:Uncharacterized protein n=1 Tax=Aspergillus cavernicola TaxID=176166 RepID=A0ABR4IF11_9EURO